MTMNVQWRPGVKFSGRETLTSRFNQKFKPGDTVVELGVNYRAKNLYTTGLKQIKSIEPHHGEKDSAGVAVPENAVQDLTDLVTFTDGSKTLVGMFDTPQAGQDKAGHYDLRERDKDGKAVEDRNNFAKIVTLDYETIASALSRLTSHLNRLNAKLRES